MLEEYTKDDDKEDDIVEEATAGALDYKDTDIVTSVTEVAPFPSPEMIAECRRILEALAEI